MTTKKLKDADNVDLYVDGMGAGSSGDPFKPTHILSDSAGSNITNVTGSSDATSATSNRVPVVAHIKAYNGATWDLIRAGLTAITSTFTGFVNGLFFGMYNSGGITLTTGQGAPLQLTSTGLLKVDLTGTTANSVAVKTDSSAVNQPVIANTTTITGSTVTRPADTSVYASGDLAANNTTAGSVTPITFAVARANDKPFTITKAGLTKSTTSVTNAQFKLHLWNVLPTVTNGDNGVLSATKAGYMGAFDFDMSANAIFNDGARANGAPSVGASVIGSPATGTQNIYGLIEAKGAYTPGNAETFVASLEVIQD